jgi:hypothetical protein
MNPIHGDDYTGMKRTMHNKIGACRGQPSARLVLSIISIVALSSCAGSQAKKNEVDADPPLVVETLPEPLMQALSDVANDMFLAQDKAEYSRKWASRTDEQNVLYHIARSPASRDNVDLEWSMDVAAHIDATLVERIFDRSLGLYDRPNIQGSMEEYVDHLAPMLLWPAHGTAIYLSKAAYYESDYAVAYCWLERAFRFLIRHDQFIDSSDLPNVFGGLGGRYWIDCLRPLVLLVQVADPPASLRQLIQTKVERDSTSGRRLQEMLEWELQKTLHQKEIAARFDAIGLMRLPSDAHVATARRQLSRWAYELAAAPLAGPRVFDIYREMDQICKEPLKILGHSRLMDMERLPGRLGISPADHDMVAWTIVLMRPDYMLWRNDALKRRALTAITCAILDGSEEDAIGLQQPLYERLMRRLADYDLDQEYPEITVHRSHMDRHVSLGVFGSP